MPSNQFASSSVTGGQGSLYSLPIWTSLPVAAAFAAMVLPYPLLRRSAHLGAAGIRFVLRGGERVGAVGLDRQRQAGERVAVRDIDGAAVCDGAAA